MIGHCYVQTGQACLWSGVTMPRPADVSSARHEFAVKQMNDLWVSVGEGDSLLIVNAATSRRFIQTTFVVALKPWRVNCGRLISYKG
jgi:hypothetical protein